MEWDNNKNRLNLEKHGLSFEDAQLVFEGECITFSDDRTHTTQRDNTDYFHEKSQ
jgi:uncharacterized DUF497 family protein